MKLILACLLAGAALSNVCVARKHTPQAPEPVEPSDVSSKPPVVTNHCPAGTLPSTKKDIIIFHANQHHFIESCNIAGSSDLNIDLSQTYGNPSDVPSLFLMKDSSIGSTSLLAIRGPGDQFQGQRHNPFDIHIHNNKFGHNCQVFIDGSFSPNSRISLTGNTFSVSRPLDRFSSNGLTNTTAIAIAINNLYLWDNAALRIVNNDISVRDTKGRYALHAVSFRQHAYWFGANSTVQIAHNNIGVHCDPSLFNNTLCAFGIHGSHTMHMYVKDSRFLVDHNTFNVTGGLLWRMPSFLSHLASAQISASNNVGFSSSEKNPSSCLIRRYAPFAEFGIMNLGAQTYLDVNDNKFECKGKSGVLGFPTDFTATDHSFITIKGNEINTKGCSPSIYFMNTFALTQKAVLWIDSNVNSRADLLTSGLASVYFAGEFSVQHDAEFTVSRNTFGRARTVKPKTKMIGLAPSAINSWKVEEQASIHMCGNIYNGIDVSDEDELKPHIALKMQEVVICEECRTERRPYSDDFEPGGADDVTVEHAEFGEDASMEYTKALIREHTPEVDSELNEGEEELVAAVMAAHDAVGESTEDADTDEDIHATISTAHDILGDSLNAEL